MWQTIGTIVFSVLFSVYLLAALWQFVKGIIESRVLYGSSQNYSAKRRRRKNWDIARKKLIDFMESASIYPTRYKHCVVAILYFELTRTENIKKVFIEHGFAQAQVDLASRIDKISHFVSAWKENNEYLTAEQLVITYINENNLKDGQGNYMGR